MSCRVIVLRIEENAKTSEKALLKITINLNFSSMASSCGQT
jgi:hypothetical protein